MRWKTAFEPRDDGEPERAIVEAVSSADAVRRLREVVGPDTDVLYVMPEAMHEDEAPDPDAETYEDFLNDPQSV